MWKAALIVPLLLAGNLAADFDLPGRFAPASLFEDEPELAIRKGVSRDHEPPGEYALSFWGCPVTRFYGGPGAYAGGGGVGFTYRPVSFFAASAGLGVWAGKLSYRLEDRFGRGETLDAPVRVLELWTGPRFHPIVWNTGSIYGEIRFSYSVADGPDPVLRTQSWGVDHYFGFELGIKPGYFFGEFGFGARVALFRKKGGWVGTPETLSGEVGGVFELMRFGLRWYF